MKKMRQRYNKNKYNKNKYKNNILLCSHFILSNANLNYF